MVGNPIPDKTEITTSEESSNPVAKSIFISKQSHEYLDNNTSIVLFGETSIPLWNHYGTNQIYNLRHSSDEMTLEMLVGGRFDLNFEVTLLAQLNGVFDVKVVINGHLNDHCAFSNGSCEWKDNDDKGKESLKLIEDFTINKSPREYLSNDHGVRSRYVLTVLNKEELFLSKSDNLTIIVNTDDGVLIANSTLRMQMSESDNNEDESSMDDEEDQNVNMRLKSNEYIASFRSDGELLFNEPVKNTTQRVFAGAITNKWTENNTTFAALVGSHCVLIKKPGKYRLTMKKTKFFPVTSPQCLFGSVADDRQDCCFKQLVKESPVVNYCGRKTETTEFITKNNIRVKKVTVSYKNDQQFLKKSSRICFDPVDELVVSSFIRLKHVEIFSDESDESDIIDERSSSEISSSLVTTSHKTDEIIEDPDTNNITRISNGLGQVRLSTDRTSSKTQSAVEFSDKSLTNAGVRNAVRNGCIMFGCIMLLLLICYSKKLYLCCKKRFQNNGTEAHSQVSYQPANTVVNGGVHRTENSITIITPDEVEICSESTASDCANDSGQANSDGDAAITCLRFNSVETVQHLGNGEYDQAAEQPNNDGINNGQASHLK